jgi:hypothetical protein
MREERWNQELGARSQNSGVCGIFRGAPSFGFETRFSKKPTTPLSMATPEREIAISGLAFRGRYAP